MRPTASSPIGRLTALASVLLGIAAHHADAAEPRPADIVLFYGQSNAGAGGSARPALTAPVSPDRVFSFARSRQAYGGVSIDPESLMGLGPVSDDARYAPFPATAFAQALSQTNRTPIFVYTVWFGGQPLVAFGPGQTSFADLMAAASAAPVALAGHGLAGHVSALVLIQGEAGPPGRETYRSLLNAVLDQALPALARQAHQAEKPVAILVQTNASKALPAPAQGVALAQWDVAAARPADTILAGPLYQCPLSDSVHQSTEGRMILGDMLAQAYETRIVQGKPFEPLHPVSARRIGRDVRIQFSRPAGSLPLAWDRGWMPDTPLFGFALSPGSGSDLDGVAITGPSEVTLHLDRVPVGPVTVRYAMDQPRLDGWAPGRGQLVAPTLRRSAFAGLGRPLPRTVSHYAIRFELVVT